MSYNLGQKAKVVSGLNPAAQSAGSANGLIIDRFGFYDGIVFLNVGAASGAPTAQGVALKVQTGNATDGSDMADVSGDAISAVTTNSTGAELNLDFNSYGRYLRVVVTTTFTGGTSPAIPVAVAVALGNSVNVPV